MKTQLVIKETHSLELYDSLKFIGINVLRIDNLCALYVIIYMCIYSIAMCMAIYIHSGNAEQVQHTYSTHLVWDLGHANQCHCDKYGKYSLPPREGYIYLAQLCIFKQCTQINNTYVNKRQISYIYKYVSIYQQIKPTTSCIFNSNCNFGLSHHCTLQSQTTLYIHI